MADNPPRDPRTRNQADLSDARSKTTPRRKLKTAAAAQHKPHEMAFLAERGLLPQPETLQPTRPTAQAA